MLEQHKTASLVVNEMMSIPSFNFVKNFNTISSEIDSFAATTDDRKASFRNSSANLNFKKVKKGSLLTKKGSIS
jgi:hypothetical protein